MLSDTDGTDSTVKNINSICPVCVGLCQGCPLSPILFVIFIDRLLKAHLRIGESLFFCRLHRAVTSTSTAVICTRVWGDSDESQHFRIWGHCGCFSQVGTGWSVRSMGRLVWCLQWLRCGGEEDGHPGCSAQPGASAAHIWSGGKWIKR